MAEVAAAAASSGFTINPTWLIAVGSATVALLAVLGLFWKVSGWVRDVDTAKEGWKTVADNIVEQFSAVNARIDKIFSLLGQQSFLEMKSPMALNALGEKVWGQLDAEDWLVREVAAVTSRVQGLSEYDVQEFCFEHMASLEFGSDQTRRAKMAAYKNGLTEFQVRQIMAIKLRDALLQEREPAELLEA